MNALNISLLIIIVCFFTTVKAQNTVTGKVLDERTNEVISFATVTFLGTNNGSTADINGVFKVVRVKVGANDTLLFAAVGYKPLKLAVTKVSSMEVRLQEDITTLREVNVNDKRRELQIGNYNIAPKVNFLNTGGQMAKRFEMPSTHQYLKEIWVMRDPTFNGHSPETTFRIQIYDENPDTKGPGKKISMSTIEVNDVDNREIKIDVSKYDLSISSKFFFVAIETLNIPTNERYRLIRAGSVVDGIPENPAYYQILYQPYFSVGRSKGNEGWLILPQPGANWKRYSLYPAIKIVVN